jgi:uncharacterized protein (TIGR00251 family)
LSAQSFHLEQTDAGVLLPIKAQPGASRDGLQGWHDGRLRVAVTQIAEKGKANKRLREVIAKGLGLKRSQVTLVSGATSSEKKFLITGIPAQNLAAKLT